MLIVLLLLGSLSVPAAGAAETTTEQKFEFLKQKGIFAGFSDGSAGLYQSMTREQFAQTLYKLMELPEPSGPPAYLDVLRTRWSYKPVAAVTNAGLMVGIGTRKFGPDSPVTVEQMAAVFVRSYGWSGGSTFVSGKVSKWARASVSIALQQKLIPAMSDYTEPATRGLLVEAAYRVYADTRQEPLRVKSVTPISNRQISVSLHQAVSSVDKSHFRLRDVLGVEINIQQAVLSSNRMSIQLTTDAQTPGRSYSLSIDGALWTFTALTDDNVKPFVAIVLPQADSKLELYFSEPVDTNSAVTSANYSINNNLRIRSIELSGDNRKVTLTLVRPNDVTAYTISVRNIKDWAGNVMDPWSKSLDFTLPRITSFRIDDSTARITLTFSERVNAQQAAATGNYSLDKGLSVIRAELDGSGRTVTLTTTPQKDATIYTLTVAGIRDLTDNPMQPQSFPFASVANPVLSLRLQTATAVNKNTLELLFNRTVSEEEVAKIGTAVLTDNGSAVSMNGWQSYKVRKSGNDRIAVVQFRTSGDANPHLFKPAHLYNIRVAGLAYLETQNAANEDQVAGTQTDNPIPEVSQAAALSASTIRIQFSEPVKNVSEIAFLLNKKDGTKIRISGDSLNNTGRVATEVVLTLTDMLERGTEYVLTFRGGTVTDAAGWNGFRTRSGDQDFAVIFRGV
jgi:methionine-rich copper-binding protein CopC